MALMSSAFVTSYWISFSSLSSSASMFLTVISRSASSSKSSSVESRSSATAAVAAVAAGVAAGGYVGVELAAASGAGFFWQPTTNSANATEIKNERVILHLRARTADS
jgi:hypothetical protein